MRDYQTLATGKDAVNDILEYNLYNYQKNLFCPEGIQAEYDCCHKGACCAWYECWERFDKDRHRAAVVLGILGGIFGGILGFGGLGFGVGTGIAVGFGVGYGFALTVGFGLALIQCGEEGREALERCEPHHH